MSKQPDDRLPSQTLADATTEELAEALEALDTVVGLRPGKPSSKAAIALARLWIEGELRKRGGKA